MLATLAGLARGAAGADLEGRWASLERPTSVPDARASDALEQREAPGIPGARISAVLEEARDWAERAAYVVRLAPGRGGVTQANDVALLAPGVTGNLRPLLREGDVVDGLAVGERFAGLHLTDTSAVLVADLGGEDHVLRIDPRGAITDLAAPGRVVEKARGKAKLNAIGDARELRVNAWGHAVFLGSLVAPSGGRGAPALLVADGLSIRAVAAADDVVPARGAAPRCVESPSGTGAINQDGAILFSMRTRAARGSASRVGMWVSLPSGRLAVLAEETAPVRVQNPDRLPRGGRRAAPLEYGRFFGPVGMDDAGTLAFLADVVDPSDTDGRWRCLLLGEPAGDPAVVECRPLEKAEGAEPPALAAATSTR